MEAVDIAIELRNGTGTGVSRRLRREGKYPGVYYGPKMEPVHLQVNGKELLKSISDLGGSHLIRMKSSSSLLDGKVVLIKQVQFHAVTGKVLHLDFYGVDLMEKLTVKVPLHFEGKPVGVVQGGVLQPIVREIEVECLPQNIPSYLNVDVTPLNIGDTIHVSSLSIPEGVAAVYDSDFTLVTVSAPTVEEEAKVEEAPVAEGAQAPAAAEEKPKESSGSKS